ncbi:MAG TPA: transcriptional regulator BetI [Steroidobacteraceae bacterium]|jgi:AcrR family transcriptional regulator
MALSAARGAAKPRWERQLPAQRRQELIDATIECLKRYGHEGLSMRAIATQAGVSLGLINHHFPNKDELIAAAYRHFNTELVDGLKAAVQKAPAAPRARMRAFFKASFSRPNLDPEALAVWVVFWGMYRHSPLIQGVHRESYQGYVQLLRDMLTELVRDAPRQTPPVDLRLAAIGLTALLDGLWLEWCLEPASFRPAEAIGLCEAWVDHLVRRTDGSALE